MMAEFDWLFFTEVLVGGLLSGSCIRSSRSVSC